MIKGMKTVSMIFAVSENDVIGRNNKIPWHLPDDFAFFKRTTLHHPVIMGRRTFEGIGRPLPQRQNIVVTHQTEYEAEGVELAHTLQEAINKAHNDEVFVIGGRQLFEEALPVAQRLYVTQVHATIEGGDTFLHIDYSHWLEE